MKSAVTSTQEILETEKLVLASGNTSIPSMPALQGRQLFHGPIVHNVDFGSSDVLTDPSVQRITVLGGGKSSADMAYAAVKAGKKVSWIVRRSGTGPAHFMSIEGVGPYKGAFDLGM